jgi:hypothetical protein
MTLSYPTSMASTVLSAADWKAIQRMATSTYSLTHEETG